MVSYSLETYKLGNVKVEHECTWIDWSKAGLWISSSLNWKVGGRPTQHYTHKRVLSFRVYINTQSHSLHKCASVQARLKTSSSWKAFHLTAWHALNELLPKVFIKWWTCLQENEEEKGDQRPKITPHALLLLFHPNVLMKATMWLSVSVDIKTSGSILCPTTDNQSDSTREFALLSGSHL